jgi:ATP-binding cassette subfamily C protein
LAPDWHRKRGGEFRQPVWLQARLHHQANANKHQARAQQENKTDLLQDLDAVRTFLSSSAPAVLFDLPWVPFYLGLLYLFHPLLGGLALAGMVVLVAVMLATALLTRAPTRMASLHAKERQRLAEASRRNAELLTSLGMTRRYRERWAKINNRYMESHQRASDVSGGLGALSRALRMMLQSAVLALGAYLVIYQEATAGIIIAGSILTGRALAPLDAAIPNAKNWTAARQSWKRLSQILQSVAERRIVLPLPGPRERLTLETASAAPPGVNKLVVQDAAFTLRGDKVLALLDQVDPGNLRLPAFWWASGRQCAAGCNSTAQHSTSGNQSNLVVTSAICRKQLSCYPGASATISPGLNPR